MFQATGLGLNSAIPRTRGVAFGGKGCGAAAVQQGRPGSSSERLRLAQPLLGWNPSPLMPK